MNISTINSTQNASDSIHLQKNGANLMEVVYLLLVATVSTTTHTAEIKAKQEEGQAHAEQLLNDEAAQLKWNSVPNLTPNKDLPTHAGSLASEIWHNIWFGSPPPPKYSPMNMAKVQEAQTADEKIGAVRTTITQELQDDQQNFQVKSTELSVLAQTATQQISQASKLISAIQSLTYNALLTNPPRN